MPTNLENGGSNFHELPDIFESKPKIAEPIVSPMAATAQTSAVKPHPFKFLKRPKFFIIIGVFLVLAVGAYFAYDKIVNQEIISQFELKPKIADAAGIPADTTFILKSSNVLTAEVVRDNLAFTPTIEFSVDKISENAYEVKPKKNLVPDQVYSVKIGQGPLAEKTYSWAYQVKSDFQILATLPRNLGSSVPINTSIEVTFNRQNLDQPENYFSISPEVKGKFEFHRDTLVFVPQEQLKQQTIYMVTIKRGIRASGSADTLSEDKIISFETEKPYVNTRQIRTPYFSFYRMFSEFSPDNEVIFQVGAGNIPADTINLKIFKFDGVEDYLNSYKQSVDPQKSWTRYHFYKPLEMPDSKKVMQSDIKLEKKDYTYYLRLPQKLGEGQYLAEVELEGEKIQTWLQVTNIGTYSNVANDNTLIWIKDVSSGQALENAEVTLSGLALGKSNADGVMMANTPEELKSKVSNFYRDWSQTDYSIKFFMIKSSGREIAVPVESQYGYFYGLSPKDLWWEYFSTDRSIYQPTDKINFWGVIKQREADDIKGQELTVQLVKPSWNYGRYYYYDCYDCGYYGPRGNNENEIVYAETKIAVSDFYTIKGELSFDSLKPGYYQLAVKKGEEVLMSESVNIESYIKPLYKLTVAPDKQAVFAGETVKFNVKAEFFDGTPVPNIKLQYNAYFHGNQEGKFELDENGEGSFNLKTEYWTDQYNTYWPRYLGVNISPAVAEEGEIYVESHVLVFGPNMDLNIEQSYSSALTKYDLDLKKIVLDKIVSGQPYWMEENYLGDPVSGWQINAQVKEIIYTQKEIRRDYDPVSKTTYPVYSYGREEISRKQEVLTTSGEGQAHFEWQAEEKKHYEVIFTTKDSNNREISQKRYIYGSPYSYYQHSYGTGGSSYLQFKNLEEKNSYKLNDNIHYRLQDEGGNTVEPGTKKYILIKSNNGQLSYQLSDQAEYQDTFKQEYVPNIEVRLAWLDGVQFNDSYVAHLRYNSEEKRLNIKVTPDQERYRPGDKVNLDFKVTDQNDNPKEAELNISGIDQAVFLLAPEEEDIVGGLYAGTYTAILKRKSHYELSQSISRGLTDYQSGDMSFGLEAAPKTGMGGCFLAGTKIKTLSGEESIEDLRIGDLVLTRASEYDSSQIEARIRKISRHLVHGYLIVNKELKVTPNHKIWINNLWQPAGKLKTGDWLLNDNDQKIKVASIEYIDEVLKVYNIELENYHTYFAEGIYVHNEEKGGGGGVRKEFKDSAIFNSISTNSKGEAKFSFDLPDNLTSWRITTQALSQDWFAGKNVAYVPVSLPFFVETALNHSYLAGDELVIRARAFGTANVRSNITYTVESETLPFKKLEQKGGKEVEINLGQLTPGQHQLKISASSGEYNDAIIREVNVVSSYFTKHQADYYDLSDSLSGIKASQKGLTTLTFTSAGRGKLYHQLSHLRYGNGKRLDQVISSKLAAKSLNELFQEENEVGAIDAQKYQTSEGGMALLPYSDNDLRLSAIFANVVKGQDVSYSHESLKEYLYSSLNDRGADLGRVSQALYGLSAYNQPILITLQNVINEKDLRLEDRIYLAMALDNLGAKEQAREIYLREIKPNLTIKDKYSFLDKLNQDDNQLFTVLLANLTLSLAEPESVSLGNYAFENYPKETLNYFEKLLYLRNYLPTLKEGDVSFAYQTNKQSGTQELKGSEKITLQMLPDELVSLKFSNIQGDVALVVKYEKYSSPEEIVKDDTLQIGRSYSVNGQRTIEFKEGDLVRIELTPSFKNGAPSGAYEVVDYLPSGLRAIANLPWRPYSNYGMEYYSHPLEVIDQKISFMTWNGNYNEPLVYYARAVSKGNYKAEPTLLQSVRALEIANIGNPAPIKIK